MIKKDSNRYGRSELVFGLSHLEGMSESEARRIVDQLIEQIRLALVSGKSVYLPKLGSFTPILRETYKGVHPLTLEPRLIKPTVKIRFRPSSTLVSYIKDHVAYFVKRKLDKMGQKESFDYYERIKEVEESVAIAKELRDQKEQN
jgi:nucleoid DNA-binding protein